MQSAYTSAIERSLLKWNGRDCDGSMHYAIEFLLLSCDYVLKFDWYCQLSGSGSNSLNSRKLSCQAVSPTATRLPFARTYNLERSLVSAAAAVLLSVRAWRSIERVSVVSWQHQKFTEPQVCLVLQLLSMYMYL